MRVRRHFRRSKLMGFLAYRLAKSARGQPGTSSAYGQGPAELFCQSNGLIGRKVGCRIRAAPARHWGIGIGDIIPEQDIKVLGVGASPSRSAGRCAADRAIVHHHPTSIGGSFQGKLSVSRRKGDVITITNRLKGREDVEIAARLVVG